jgi:hypothetical protein
MVSETGQRLAARGVAFAAEAVKGLPSPSLASMNSANYQTVRFALDWLLAAAERSIKELPLPLLKTAPETILFKPLLCPTIGERLMLNLVSVNRI